jgi:hypothetical protein
MKKGSFIKILSALLLIVATILLAACSNAGQGECRIVIVEEGGAQEYTVKFNEENSSEGVFGLIKELCEKENIHIKYTNSIYGAYIEEIASIKPNASAGEYVGLFTSVTSDFDVSVMFSEYEYDGLTLGSLGVGASLAKIEDGATYLIKILSY